MLNTASIRPIDTAPICTPESDKSRMHPVIVRQASSCWLKPESALLEEKSDALRLMKYAPAPAITASITHSVTSLSSDFALSVRAIPVAKIGRKATADGKMRLSEIFRISWNTQRIAPMAMITPI